MVRIFYLSALFLSLAFTGNAQTGYTETPFLQPVSIQYGTVEKWGTTPLKKVVADFNDQVFVLSEAGVARISGEQLIEDIRYRPLAGKIPADITIQEGTGYLYYLFEDHYLTNERAGVPYGRLDKGAFQKIAVNQYGTVLVAGEEKGAMINGEEVIKVTLPQKPVLSLQVEEGEFYALTETGVYRLSGKEFIRICEGQALTSMTFWKGDILLGTPGGYYAVNKATGAESMPLQTKIPVREIQQLALIGGRLWAATENGIFMEKETEGYRYFASRRWLEDNNVIDLAADSEGNIFALSSSGLSEIRFVPMTYLEKAAYFEKKIRERHIRYGLLSEVRMTKPGDLATAELIDTDNDGLWTAFYLGAEALRYAVTGDPTAKRHVWESFEAYERLLTVNQVEGFPSRTFERKGYKYADPKAWRASPEEGWEWKGTTSSDEFVGYIFIAALMNEMITETPTEKKRVADFLDQILMHIIDHDYNFVDLDGEPTLWGRWHPDYVNSYAKTISDRKLASVDLIAGLQIGYALTGRELFKTEAERLMKEHGYLENIMISPFDIEATPGYTYEGHDMGMGPWNHSDDEMEFLSFWPLYHYAFDEDLKEKYAKVIDEFWEIERPEGHPAWNLITLALGGSFDKEETLWYLREYPTDLIRWTVKNSHRKDLNYLESNFRNQHTDKALSPLEKPIQRFNANEFTLDGGNGGHSELTGAEYLFSYWLARYLNVID